MRPTEAYIPRRPVRVSPPRTPVMGTQAEPQAGTLQSDAVHGTEADNVELVHERMIELEDESGVVYDRARVYAEQLDTGRWAGFIEFVTADGMSSVRSPRETTQRNLDEMAYWATGLEPTYFEGALERALREPSAHDVPEPVPTGPAPTAGLRSVGLEIESAEPTLALDLMGTQTLTPGSWRRIQETGLLVYEGTLVSPTATEPGRFAFLLYFGSDNSAALVANFLWNELHGKVVAVNIDGLRVNLTNSALKETLLARAA
jgi:hypothetical protein